MSCHLKHSVPSVQSTGQRLLSPRVHCVLVTVPRREIKINVTRVTLESWQSWHQSCFHHISVEWQGPGGDHLGTRVYSNACNFQGKAWLVSCISFWSFSAFSVRRLPLPAPPDGWQL